MEKKLSLAEWFQAFHRYAVENDLSASARVLFYTLLGLFNAEFWKVDRVSISVRQMQALGGFQSSSVVERAKTVLGTENIVKIEKLKNNKTQFELVEPQLWLRHTRDTPAEHSRNTCGTPAEHSRNTAYTITLPKTKQEDIKTEDIKTKEKNAHARGFPKVRDVERLIEYFSLELDIVLVRDWEEEKICDELTPYDLKILSDLQKKYGVEKLKTAMGQAYHKYGRYAKVGAIQDCLEKLNSSQKTEGDGRSYGRDKYSVYADLR